MPFDFFFAAAFAAVVSTSQAASPADFVDTRFGSRHGSGTCVLGPCVPHGSVYPSPDSLYPAPNRAFPCPSGYFPGDPVAGFSQLHISGTGGVPTFGLFRLVFGEPSAMRVREAKPYRFRATLLDLGVDVAVSATHNGAIYAYTGKEPTLDAAVKIGSDRASENATVAREGNALFGGGTYSGNWNPAPYDCWFYATSEPGVFRIAVSFVSIAEARAFHDSELKGRTLDEIADDARAAWNARLSRIEIGGVDDAERARFYSHLYHVFIQPHERSGTWDDHYTIWDTWKTVFPLMTLLEPSTVASVVNSFADRLEKNGRCEAAFIQGKEMRVGQGGNDVDNIIADARAKGVPGIDWDRAWKILAAHAVDRTPDYIAKGYVASDAAHDYCWRLKSGSSTLAFAYNDWCAAQVAKSLGKTEIAARLEARSANWTNVWDSAMVDLASGYTGFVRGRRADGSFGATLVDGSPEPLDARTQRNGSFYEGSCWVYSYNVWHDIPALMEKCGGPGRFADRLAYAFENGLIDFSNEPSFYTPWLFTFAGRQEMTRKWVGELLKAFPADGCPGDDDSGAMGSLYVFIQLGFMPIAGSDRYVYHGTRYPEITIKATDGEVLRFGKDLELPPVFTHSELKRIAK